MKSQLLPKILVPTLILATHPAFAAEPAPAAVPPATLITEAEEFVPAKAAPDWKAGIWGENMFAATIANTFLSRKAFLGAPEQTQDAAASIEVNVPAAGKYLALVRYECAPRFATQFRLRIEQKGVVKLDRLYGARENLKIWPFGEKLKTEVIWPWGSNENMVWEGHDAAVQLDAGPARLTLIAPAQPTPAARRNVDVVMLTMDQAGVANRIEKEPYLPLDGMLDQTGDLFVKARNNSKAPLVLNISRGRDHSPYFIHMRDVLPKTVTVAPGQTTDWIETGSLLDTLNDGQWPIEAKNQLATDKTAVSYDLIFGVPAKGGIRTIRTFARLNADVQLAYFANTRVDQRVLLQDEVLYNLVAYLKQQKVAGTAPRRTPIYGYTFDPHPKDAKYTAARAEFVQLMGANALLSEEEVRNATAGTSLRNGYIDVRSQGPTELAKSLTPLHKSGHAGDVAAVSMGDEIGLPLPSKDDQAGFRAWLQTQKVTPAEVDPAAASWDAVSWSNSAETKAQKPALFYYSTRYAHDYGIQQTKVLTDEVAKYLPNAGIGANFSPHHGVPYVGEAHKWARLFREGGLTMPWSEDYIWQIPIGSQQMGFYNVDLFRAGLKNRPGGKIHMYVMAHSPGNTPNSWRRQFYGDIAHGTKIFNLYELRPVQSAYTENYVNSPAMYDEVRRGLYELGTFEDIVQDGAVRPAETALLAGETSDIWLDNGGSFGAARRTLYVAIRQQQLPLDLMLEEDAAGGSLQKYKVLYLTDRHVSRAASGVIAAWVEQGGTLFATAGAGMRDELDKPNDVLQKLLGAKETALVQSPEPIIFEKQDLPFAASLETVKWSEGGKELSTPAFGAVSRFTAADGEVTARFSDGTPAVVSRTAGRGRATYVGFLPGLSYFKPAIPLRPVDRGSTDDAMTHFIPTAFDQGAASFIAAAGSAVARPVKAADPLVESTVIEAKSGTLVSLINWRGAMTKGLAVTLDLKTAPFKSVRLASGRPVKVTRDNGNATVVFDLGAADALILRP